MTTAWNIHKYINFKINPLNGKAWEERYQELKRERQQFLGSLTEEQRGKFMEEEREESRERQRRWRQSNPEQVKAYYEANKDKIKEQNKKRITCECGVEVARQSMSSHRKTKAHLAWKDSPTAK